MIKKLLNFFAGRGWNYSPSNKEDAQTANSSNEFQYEVFVEIDNLGALVDEEKIKEALTGKLQGECSITLCFAETSKYSTNLCRKFALTNPDDFTIFAEAIKMLPGVIGVIKGDGPWKKSREELNAELEITKQKEQTADDAFKKRKQQLEEYLKISEETTRKDIDAYGAKELFSPIDFNYFLEVLKRIEGCEVEIVMATSDPLAGGFLEYKRSVEQLAKGEDAVAFFEKALNGDFKPIFVKETRMDRIPFSVEYRHVSGKSLIHLVAGSGNPMFMIYTYELFVRQTA